IDGYPARHNVYPYRGPDRGGAGYWGEDPDRQHRRAEWYGLRNHQERERYIYGDSPELREHHEQERWQLRHEQWHERNGDYEVAGNLQEFEARWARGKFDTGKLDKAIHNLEHLAGADRVRGRDRDMLARDLEDLRRFRASRGLLR